MSYNKSGNDEQKPGAALLVDVLSKELKTMNENHLSSYAFSAAQRRAGDVYQDMMQSGRANTMLTKELQETLFEALNPPIVPEKEEGKDEGEDQVLKAADPLNGYKPRHSSLVNTALKIAHETIDETKRQSDENAELPRLNEYEVASLVRKFMMAAKNEYNIARGLLSATSRAPSSDYLKDILGGSTNQSSTGQIIR